MADAPSARGKGLAILAIGLTVMTGSVAAGIAASVDRGSAPGPAAVDGVSEAPTADQRPSAGPGRAGGAAGTARMGSAATGAKAGTAPTPGPRPQAGGAPAPVPAPTAPAMTVPGGDDPPGDE
ncbi:MAG TPA: hypothetical protein VI011_18320 [Asanoa sp.]